MKFEIYRSGTGWRWRLVASNGRIIATAGEAYVNFADCQRSIEITQTAGREDWDVYDAPKGPYAKAFYVFTDTSGEYRWRLYAVNGHIVAVSSEGYNTRAGAHGAIALVKGAGAAPIYREAA